VRAGTGETLAGIFMRRMDIVGYKPAVVAFLLNLFFDGMHGDFYVGIV
jgi:hypothetical protein